MSELLPGTRVGAFESSSAAGEIRLYGYGTYTGVQLVGGWRSLAHEIAPIQRASWQASGDERATWSDERLIEWLSANAPALSNPRIELDDGRLLWGYEAWWMAEDRARELVTEQLSQGYRLIEV